MKFSCERCGKKYATAEEPAPGRVYRLKCRACGHVIVVRGSPGATVPPPSPGPGAGRGPVAAPPTPDPPPVPEIPLEVAAPEPAAAIDAPGLDLAPPPPPRDATTEISVATATFAEVPAPIAPDPPRDGWGDLFGEGGEEGVAEPPPRGLPEDDPFLAAARASLPEGYGAGSAAAPDPFAPLREAAAEGGPDASGPAPRTAIEVPVIPKPAPATSAMPLLLIGAGVLVLVGILGFVLLSGKTVDPARRPAARAATPAAAPVGPADPPAPPAREPPPPAAEQPAGHRAAPEAAGRATAEERRGRDREARAREEREEREEQERAAREREARARAEARERERREAERREAERVAVASLPAAETGLSQAQIDRVLQSTKKAFDGCIDQAKAAGMKLDGRRVLLRLNIQTSGAVTYPTLDDVTLNSTDLGACLKSAARLMVFPKFKGDTLHVELPFVLR